MGGFRLGRIFGFEIRIDFSWFVIFALILWSFTVSVFPAQVPGRSTVTYLAMGFAGAVLFFASLVIHELSHSLVARAKGIPVEGITLFIFGGMAHTRREAETPGDEFQIAGIGPVTSLLIAAVLVGIWYFGTRAGLPAAALIVVRWVGWLNLVLAVFNLLPGFPLDGGRLFRAVVWRLTGSMTKGTRVASMGGRWLAYLLIAWGLIMVFRGNPMGGLWLVFIGWFLRNAAIASFRQHMLRETLSDATARQAMTPVPQTVPADISLQQLMEDYFLRRRFLSYPVEDNGAAVGIVTLNQVKQVAGDSWPHVSVRETMTAATPDLIVAPEDAMTSVLEKLQRSPVKRLLVLRNGGLEGIITTGDVAAWLEKTKSIQQ